MSDIYFLVQYTTVTHVSSINYPLLSAITGSSSLPMNKYLAPIRIFEVKQEAVKVTQNRFFLHLLVSLLYQSRPQLLNDKSETRQYRS